MAEDKMFSIVDLKNKYYRLFLLDNDEITSDDVEDFLGFIEDEYNKEQLTK